ncbi:MAG: DUF2807 domain-containing protein [Pseudomonadota bacterium]
MLIKLTLRPLAAAIAAGGALLANAHAEPRVLAVDGAFNSIHAARGVSVTLSMGEIASVTADTDDPDFARLEAFVEDDTLHVRREGLSDYGDGFDIRVDVTATRLVRIKVSTGARIDGADLKLDPDAEVIVDTGGVADLSGRCRDLFAKAETGGVIAAQDLQCDIVKAKARTGGEVDVYASDTAEGYARLGGEVTIHGDATITKRGRFLGGEVRSAN